VGRDQPRHGPAGKREALAAGLEAQRPIAVAELDQPLLRAAIGSRAREVDGHRCVVLAASLESGRSRAGGVDHEEVSRGEDVGELAEREIPHLAVGK
jgi:hypothetical protein